MGKFSGNTTFTNLLSKKRQEILQRTSDGVQETPQFKRLHSLLSECRRKNREVDFKLVIISKADLSKLSNDADIRVKELFKNPKFLTNRTVYVDSELAIFSSNNDHFPEGNNEARRFFASLSETKDALVVFHIAPDAIVNYFIDGKDFGDGVFYTLAAQSDYEQLKPIGCLKEVLDEYRIKLKHQDTYLKFFVTKAGLCALHTLSQSTETQEAFIDSHKHLLHNKPEFLFHEDMRNYIKQHMRVVVYREVVLENLDKLDIELIDERGEDLYFIEVKWVGESISQDGSKFGTEYDAHPRIRPDAVKQVVGYIEELLNEGKNIKVGYLAVFDARKEDLPDTGEGSTETDVPEEVRKYYPRFVKLKDFRVKNINPR